MDLVQNDQNSEIKDFIMKALNKSDKAEADNQQTVSARKIETPQVEKPEVQETMTEDGEKSFSNEINKANLSLKELIANAKQKLEIIMIRLIKKMKPSREEKQRLVLMRRQRTLILMFRFRITTFMIQKSSGRTCC